MLRPPRFLAADDVLVSMVYSISGGYLWGDGVSACYRSRQEMDTVKAYGAARYRRHAAGR